MNSKNKISISFRDKVKNQEGPFRQAKDEQAASAEPESGDDERYHKPKIYSLPVKKKNRRSRSLVKPILISSISALVISLGLGFVLLRMFVSITDDTAVGQAGNASPAATQDTAGSATIGTSTVEGYVVQAGVFSTEEKANEWKMKLTASAFSSVVWQRDGQYYLFVGSGSSEAEAEQVADQLKSGGFDTYVKPWTVLTEKTELEAAEAEVADQMSQYVDQHSFTSFSEEGRQQYIVALEKSSPDSPFLEAFRNWESSDRQHLNWLRAAKAMEETMK
ncbi:SPOR domain-containing protein [Halobacillus litoralis]|uniref:SPOR domain-containing protein n=1 Tax=Halobacillus litoralis TaxID=45668 RepID=UPI001CD61D23|nr:SPOR domain-containing protein [Halobacillus litoralis]MCA0969932.1 SPOR domain-containing protein [Halobacillus litoralis]